MTVQINYIRFISNPPSWKKDVTSFSNRTKDKSCRYHSWNMSCPCYHWTLFKHGTNNLLSQQRSTTMHRTYAKQTYWISQHPACKTKPPVSRWRNISRLKLFHLFVDHTGRRVVKTAWCGACRADSGGWGGSSPLPISVGYYLQRSNEIEMFRCVRRACVFSPLRLSISYLVEANIC
jgi:hypothetical protein